jgi:GDPmannose 4,6-dehydratase
MKRVLITGITGQDGSYLAENLLEKGYLVHGLVRKTSGYPTVNIEHLFPKFLEKSLFLHYGDILDPINLLKILQDSKPDEIYNLAAQSHVQHSFDIPVVTGAVNSLSQNYLLEIALSLNPEIRIYQASTSEMFGRTPPPQNENSKFSPQSPYAISKLGAFYSAINLRESKDAFIANGILFNHESPRRHETFVTKKIIKAAVKISKGKLKQLELGELSSIRDWGYAPEYVEAMWLMLNHSTPLDLVIATGEGVSVRKFCQNVFSKLNLNYEEFVKFNPKFVRPSEVENLIGDPSKALSTIQWKAKINWEKLINIMLEHELKLEAES